MDKQNLNDLLSRIKEGSLQEDESIEFKASFSSQGRILKTMAGLANNKGGFIVIGIEDGTHSIIGLDDESAGKFNDMEHNGFPKIVREIYNPCIAWTHELAKIDEKQVGVIIVKEAINKPIIAEKNTGSGDVKTGAIYYRYKAETTFIGHSELVTILERVREVAREKESQKWQEHFNKIALYGIDNAGVLDAETGTIHNSRAVFQLSEATFNKLNEQVLFVKEGEFNEVNGAKTLNLIGNLQISGDTTEYRITEQETAMAINPAQAHSFARDYYCLFPIKKNESGELGLYTQAKQEVIKNDGNINGGLFAKACAQLRQAKQRKFVSPSPVYGTTNRYSKGAVAELIRIYYVLQEENASINKTEE
ncbi:MAG: ATP-binding protein [Clostridiales bacterium]|jgi:hypothetical protein|nr:ATP-binding protein [Clostridiales bacterium]